MKHDPIPKKRKNRRENKPAARALAVVLSLLLTISVMLAAVPTASAKGESPFQDNECIYIDCSQVLNGGGRWEDAGAEFRVFTYYNDSYDAHFCHEFEENFATDGWFEGASVLQKGIKADKFCDHVYRFRIPGNHISHVRIARTNSGATEKWNLSPYMWDSHRNKSAGSKHNCIKITNWDNAASWTTFTPTNYAASYTKTAQPDSTITDNSSLYPVDAKFYDYYNDDEIQKGWRNINYDSNHASVNYTKNNSWYLWAGYWEPFQYLNRKISMHGGNVPLYFGNFYGKGDGYTGEGGANLSSFRNMANNSQNIYGLNKSVAGLTGDTLPDGQLVYSTNNGSSSNTTVPFFDESFLINNRVGSVVNSKFPMRKVVENGITKYEFDSYQGKDNVWLNNLGSDSPTVSYAQNSRRAIDSLYSYSDNFTGGAGGEYNGCGFFPFDGDRFGDVTAKNYGFGMRLDFDFNLAPNGQLTDTNGQLVDQVFSFAGDDDVWVYIDGKLILDLGGDHKRTEGSINFADRTVTANTGVTFNNATRNQNNFTLENEDDPTAKHTLTLFYVERGMIESNLTLSFNIAPAVNRYINDGRYYIDDVPQEVTGMVEINGVNYLFNDSFVTDGPYCGIYFDNSGDEVTGRYFESGIPVDRGVIEFDGDYYCTTTGGWLVKGEKQLDEESANGLLLPGTYTFGEDFKLILDQVKNGIVDGKYYIDDVIQEVTGLVEVDGVFFLFDENYETDGAYSGLYTYNMRDRYFQNGKPSNPGLIKVDNDIYCTTTGGYLVYGDKQVFSSRTNGILPAGTYHFDEDTGKLNMDNVIINDVYYKDGKPANIGVVKTAGGIFVTTTKGVIVKNVQNKYVASSRTNGILAPGYYDFGADGKMIPKNGIINGKYYIDGKAVNVGLFEYEIDGVKNIYCTTTGGALIKDAARKYIAKSRVNGLAAPGYYDFDADGKMITP